MRIRKNVSLTHGPATFYGSESRRLHMSAVHLFQDRPARSARRSAPPSSLRYTHKHGAHRAAVATCRRYGNVAGTCRCCRSLESWQRRRQDDDGRRARPCTASDGVFFRRGETGDRARRVSVHRDSGVTGVLGARPQKLLIALPP